MSLSDGERDEAQPFSFTEFPDTSKKGRRSQPKSGAAPDQAEAGEQAAPGGEAEAEAGQQPPQAEAKPQAGPKRKRKKRREDEFQLLYVAATDEEAPDPVEEARKEAEEVMSQAQRDADGLKRTAYEEGYSQGQEEGLTAGRARIEAASANLERMLTILDKSRQRLLGALEPEVVALVQACVDGVLMQPEAVRPQVVRSVVAKAIDSLGEAHQVTVRLCPADLQAVQEFQPELLKRFEDLQRLKVVAEESLKPGDCVVDSGTTLFDATMETRRQAVFALLEEALRTGPPLPVDELTAQDPPPRQDQPEPGDWGEPDGAAPAAQGGDLDEDW